MTCQDYVNHVYTNQQTITFSGVNDNGQNGIAEWAMQSIYDGNKLY